MLRHWRSSSIESGNAIRFTPRFTSILPHAMNRRRSSVSREVSGRVVRIGLTQMSCGPEFTANLARQVRLVERAAKQGAQIICTQELFGSQYFCQAEEHRFFKLAEKIPGPSTDAFCKIAKKHRVVIIASIFEKRA